MSFDYDLPSLFCRSFCVFVVHILLYDLQSVAVPARFFIGAANSFPLGLLLLLRPMAVCERPVRAFFQHCAEAQRMVGFAVATVSRLNDDFCPNITELL